MALHDETKPRRFGRLTTVCFGAVLPLLPAVAAITTVGLYIADTPNGNGGLQLLIGLGAGVVAWLVVSVLAGPAFTSVESASAETYEQLHARLEALHSRSSILEPEATTPAAKEATAEVHRLIALLDAELDPAGARRIGSRSRWLHGHGYINAWRDLHQAEDLLLTVEPAEVVYATALTNLDRVAGSPLEKAKPRATAELEKLVGGDGDRAKQQDQLEATLLLSGTPLLELAVPKTEEAPDELERFATPRARALVRETSYRIHYSANERWDKIVNLRNRLFLALVLTISFTYAVIVLAVLEGSDRRTEMIAACAFFLVGAAVGVFAELWSMSRPESLGNVFDYGISHVRLLATPVLSGVAAVGGVLLTNLGGSYLVWGTQDKVGSFHQILSLGHYRMGIVVAAIFGLAPNLLLDQLKKRTDGYKKQISDLDAGTSRSLGAAP